MQAEKINNIFNIYIFCRREEKEVAEMCDTSTTTVSFLTSKSYFRGNLSQKL